MKRLLTLALLAACSTRGNALTTQPVATGEIDQTVTATGTLNAQDTVLVGSQVSGTIARIFVDYNSVVRRGQVLATIDPSTMQAQLAQAEAAYGQARAATAAAGDQARAAGQNVTTADAAIAQAASAFALAEKTQARDGALLARGFTAQSTLDADENATAAASAQLRTARSQRAYAQAAAAAAAATFEANRRAVAADLASVQQARITLARATIASPVDGTVIARNVSVGQTVAAALQAPTLFTIARDLKKMQVDIAVGEPDVGAVRSGETVRFTVLAYPGVVYRGSVVQVRQNPTVVSNVTTYDTVAYVANPDGRLRPGMTANASIVVAHYPNALQVPLDALQWQPNAAIARAYGVASPSPAPSRAARRSQWGATGGAGAYAIAPNASARLWVLRDRRLIPVRVRILAVSGTTVGVVAPNGDLHDGDAAVTATP